MRLRVCASSSSFDIREHLSTKAPYVHRVAVPNAPSLYDVPDPPGYKPVFLYLLARHGSRWPTAKRMRQINSLQPLLRSVRSSAPGLAWARNWTSPVADVPYLAGELHPEGEAELEGLARRLRGRFPGLAAEPYAPRRQPIISTQVPRAAQSASAFALGFFGHTASSIKTHQPLQEHQAENSHLISSNGDSKHTNSRMRSSASSSLGDSSSSSSSRGGGLQSGVVGGWRPQPVAISMLPKRHDPVLRFFESCKGYRLHEDRALRWLAPWMHSHWRRIIPNIEARLGLTAGSLTACHVDALWQLCTLEAGLMSTAGHQAWLQQQQDVHSSSSSTSSSSSNACGLFSEADAVLLEWLEDVRLYETQGYGAEVNYGIAAPLLSDIASALTAAASSHTQNTRPLQRVRLHFAHCETLTPLASLLGLFRPGPQEPRGMPEVPSGRALKSAVKISPEQAEQDLQAVDEVTEDLPLVLLQQQQQQQEVLLAETQQAAESKQQQQHSEKHLQQYKRRRLSAESGSSSSSSTATIPDGVPAQQAAGAASPAGHDQLASQQLRRKHKHGPSTEGCSYKGNTLDPGLLLPPPSGWVPAFSHSDEERVWRGGRIAPLGANLVLILYGKEGVGSSSSGGGREGLQEYRVRLVYNEQVLPLPGCSSSSSSSNGMDCSLQEFFDVVVGDKISAERFRRLCDGAADDVADGLLGADGVRLGMHSSFSSSSSSSMSDGSWAGLSAVGLQDSPQGLQLETADGLPLLLPAISDDARPAAWHRL